MLGFIEGTGVGLSDTSNPYKSYFSYGAGKASFNTTDAAGKTSGTKNDGKSGGTDKTDENGHKPLGKFKDGFGEEECQTCKNRKYQDESDDAGVSFQTPTKLSKGEAMSAVRGHEMEHVNRNQAKASREGNEIVSQTVRIKTGICPECGEPYVAGGETRTTTRSKYNVGLSDNSSSAKGKSLDTVA